MHRIRINSNAYSNVYLDGTIVDNTSTIVINSRQDLLT